MPGVLALIPDWVEPVAEYMLREGLVNTLKIAAISLVGALVIGIVLGTLLTIEFLPVRERTQLAFSLCLAAAFAVGLAFLLNVV